MAAAVALDVADVRRSAARTVKAVRLAKVIWDDYQNTGKHFDLDTAIKDGDDTWWKLAANKAKVTVPGPATQAMVVELLAFRQDGVW